MIRYHLEYKINILYKNSEGKEKHVIFSSAYIKYFLFLCYRVSY